MLRSSVRSGIVSIASLASSSPIEVITLTFIIVTLAYFQLLHAIKGSEFFQIPATVLAPPRPVSLVRLSHPSTLDDSPFAYSSSPPPILNSFSNSNTWQPVSTADFRRVLEADALEDGYVFPHEIGGNAQGEKATVVFVKQLTLVSEAEDTADSADKWRQWLLHEAGVTHAGKKYTFSDLCFLCDPELERHPLHDSQSTLTLFLRPPSPTTPTLAFLNLLAHLPAYTSPGSNATFHVVPLSTSWGLLPSFDGAGLFANVGQTTAANGKDKDDMLTGLRSVRWFAYAARAFVMRFVSLAKNADSADIFVVLLGYILMHITFVHLFINMRKLGSSFWLPVTTLVSSTFAFLCALLCAYLLHVPIDPVSMSEALPFLVITVGFDKPFLLAQAVFEHPDIEPITSSQEEEQDNALSGADQANGNGLGLDLDTLHKELAPLERLQRMAEGKGVRWAAPVAAKQILVDAVRTKGPFIVRDYLIEIAVLSVGALSGIGGLREFCWLAALIMAADCVFLFTFYVAILSVMVEVHRIKRVRGKPKTKSLHRSSSHISLDSSIASPTGNGDKKDKDQPESPLVRLKLFLIISFLTLHILNLCTTLTEQTAITRHTTHSVPATPVFDARSPTLTPLLEKLYASLPAETDLAVQIIPQTNIVMSTGSYVTSRMATIDQFMSEWTQLVGDPVLSKWIVIALGISVLLNGYLLKGIASNSIGGKGPVAAAAHVLARILEAPTPREKERSRSRSFGALTPRASSKDGDSTPKVERNNGHVKKASFAAPPTPPPQAAAAPPPTISINNAPIHKSASTDSLSSTLSLLPTGLRSLEECIEVFAGGVGVHNLSDEEVILLVQKGKIAPYALEKTLKDLDRAVRVRRAVISRASLTQTLESSLLPLNDYDYKQIIGACCENVVGYMPLPVGIAGPLNIDGQVLHIPMATTEGTLVASTSRGCKALNAGGGVTTVLTHDAMTRGPAIDFPSVVMAADARIWIDSPEGFATVSAAFNSTSRFARLQTLECALAGRTLYVRFATSTGDAMGMNMISKGTEKALSVLGERYPEMRVLALSGNYCTDKKPAAINWIEGRGKSIVAEAIVPKETVSSVLKTTVSDLVNLNIKKNLIGSAMAGSVGGFNAHASNILTAVYLATGQDPAQNVESSNCMTLMEPTAEGDLLITVSMPSIEVGTVGGGTILSPQRAMLDLLGIAGAHPTQPGANAQRLARIIAAAVMAGELSLMSALAAGHLIQAHMKHNRSVPATPGAMTPGGVASAAAKGDMLWGQQAGAGIGGMTPIHNLSPQTTTKLVGKVSTSDLQVNGH